MCHYYRVLLNLFPLYMKTHITSFFPYTLLSISVNSHLPSFCLNQWYNTKSMSKSSWFYKCYVSILLWQLANQLKVTLTHVKLDLCFMHQPVCTSWLQIVSSLGGGSTKVLFCTSHSLELVAQLHLEHLRYGLLHWSSHFLHKEGL